MEVSVPPRRGGLPSHGGHSECLLGGRRDVESAGASGEVPGAHGRPEVRLGGAALRLQRAGGGARQHSAQLCETHNRRQSHAAPCTSARRVAYKKDTKVKDAATFIIQREDHTLGNVIRHKLLEDQDVIFAAYRIPHPLEHVMHLRVQTNGCGGGAPLPRAAREAVR